MSYLGDIRLGDTLDLKFTTRRFSTGAPHTLAGTPAVAAYVGNGTTEITAGITLTVDFDSRTGLNNVRVVATAANGFANGTDVQLVITAGTVDSVSVVGEVIGSFSIGKRVGAKYDDLGVDGVVTTGATTTSIPTSSLSPAAGVTDQFKGRVLIFDKNTATANLRGQGAPIDGNTAGGTISIAAGDALTTAPASGDTFRIV